MSCFSWRKHSYCNWKNWFAYLFSLWNKILQINLPFVENITIPTLNDDLFWHNQSKNLCNSEYTSTFSVPMYSTFLPSMCVIWYISYFIFESDQLSLVPLFLHPPLIHGQLWLVRVIYREAKNVNKVLFVKSSTAYYSKSFSNMIFGSKNVHIKRVFRSSNLDN